MQADSQLYIDQLRSCLRAFSVVTPTEYLWFGEPASIMGPAHSLQMTPDAVREALVSNLQDRLYRSFYTQGTATPVFAQSASVWPNPQSAQFARALSSANAGRAVYDDGWAIQEVREDQVVIAKEKQRLLVDMYDCQRHDDSKLCTGQSVIARFPKESFTELAGFYLAKGNLDLTAADWKTAVRIYLNTTAEGAVRAVEALTSRLNEAKIRFRLKTVGDYLGYTRCDAFVLFLPHELFQTAMEEVRATIPIIVDELKQGTPAFTFPLAKGVALAEDPGDGQSFGSHRCRIVASGLVRCVDLGASRDDDKLAVLAQEFSDCGVSLDQPYLTRSGATHRYEFAVTKVSGTASTETVEPDAKYLFLDVAERIAARLNDEALWSGEECTWIGCAPLEIDSTGATFEAIGTSLYAGTAGIAIFLAELYAQNRKSWIRRLAKGAIAHSVSSDKSLGANTFAGLFSGSAGIALAAARVGQLLDDEGAIQWGKAYLERAHSWKPPDKQFDLISGRAGTIYGLLSLGAILGLPSAAELALKLGDELIAFAYKSDCGCSWGDPNFVRTHDLTGLAHGASGPILALSELFRHTREPRFRITAEEGMRYERRWFDQRLENWADLRITAGGNVQCSCFWCHGAPGIALSRMRAYEVFGSTAFREEADAALRTTLRCLESEHRAARGNYSLCHGLSGNAEILSAAWLPTSAETATHRQQLVDEVALAGAERFCHPATRWPCGTAGPETQGLMLGLAGIGMFYLRQYNPTVPSVFLLQSHDKWTDEPQRSN